MVRIEDKLPNESSYHKPIMALEIKDFLRIRENGVYFDGTLGGGGHSEMILTSNGNCKVVATDKDDDAIAFARERLKKFKDRFIPVKSDFKDCNTVLNNLGIDKIDGAVLDLGISSFQIDNFDRGFSYRATNSPLDMRMDKTQSFSAYDIVNGYSESEIKRVLYEYGEERFAPRIAANIVAKRGQAKITTCGELVEIIDKSIPAAAKTNGHPAKKTFQAFRIEVNGEIRELEEAVENVTRRLKCGGRICVLTFHSLEDRIVKNLFRELEKDCICDKSLPVCVCGKVKEVKIITKKPQTASDEELKLNSRANSAKLRVAEKI